VKDNSRKFTFLEPVKCSRPYTGTLFPHRRMYKNRVSGGINVPVSTWEFPLFWRVFFQREASFGSLFLQCVEDGTSSNNSKKGGILYLFMWRIESISTKAKSVIFFTFSCGG
jgi:hypothetical protein